jgi:shikimate dehydrogenase
VGTSAAQAGDVGAGKRAAVLGRPIAHSLSPTLHRAAYRELGLAGWRYDAVDVGEAELPAFVAGLDDGWAGLSLTMPLKRAVLPLLDSLSDTARRLGVVNTVLPRAAGGWHGDNTDVPGMLAALRAYRVPAAPERVALLGAGATATSALAALTEFGARQVTVYARTLTRAAELRPLADVLGVPLDLQPWTAAARAFDAPLVIATTPAGASDGLAAAVPDRPGALFDVLYHPWPTELAVAWSARGGTVIGGLDLLVEQAAIQVELMTGRAPAPVAAMRAAGVAALAARA